MLVEHDELWRGHFKCYDFETLTLDYETLSNAYRATLGEALSFLGLSRSPGVVIDDPVLRRQSDRMSEEWARQYRYLKELREHN